MVFFSACEKPQKEGPFKLNLKVAPSVEHGDPLSVSVYRKYSEYNYELKLANGTTVFSASYTIGSVDRKDRGWYKVIATHSTTGQVYADSMFVEVTYSSMPCNPSPNRISIENYSGFDGYYTSEIVQVNGLFTVLATNFLGDEIRIVFDQIERPTEDGVFFLPIDLQNLNQRRTSVRLRDNLGGFFNSPMYVDYDEPVFVHHSNGKSYITFCDANIYQFGLKLTGTIEF